MDTYLKQPVNREKLGIGDVAFDREPAENDGFADIKVQTLYSLTNPEAYYIFECKRLDGTARLNREYIAEGIMRFAGGKYSSFYGLNGMIGYEVKQLDTPGNIDKINAMLLSDYPKLKQSREMEPVNIADDFNFTYRSEHCCESRRTVCLFHLMLDMSLIIETKS